MHYALNGKYPIETAEHVKTAAEYFTKNLSRFKPMDRAAAATNIEKRAQALSVQIDEPWITNYSRMLKKEAAISPDFDRNIRLRKEACLKGKIEVKVGGSVVEAEKLLDKVAELKGSVHGIAIVKALESFDKLAGLEYRYDNDIVDPVLTVFGSLVNSEFDAEKVASNITSYDLVRMSRNPSVIEKIAGALTPEFVDEFKQSPVKAYKSLGSPEKSLFSEATA